MDTKKKQEIKDKYVLKEIENDIKNVIGVSILHIYKSSDIYEEYLKRLSEIYEIGFPVLFTRKVGKNFEDIEYIYKYLNISVRNYRWLIPNFNGSNWWVELEINNLNNFIDFYCPNNHLTSLTVFDVMNSLLFDIEMGETDYEYRIVWI